MAQTCARTQTYVFARYQPRPTRPSKGRLVRPRWNRHRMEGLQEPRQGGRLAKVGMVATIRAYKVEGIASRRVRVCPIMDAVRIH